MKKSIDFVDKWGLLDKHFHRDGGDSAHREGMFWTLAYFNKNTYERKETFQEVMERIHPHPGIILRHSNIEYDASDWDRTSRDQFKPIIIACGLWDKGELKKLTLGHLKRGFLFMNNVRQNGATKRNHGEKGYSYAWRFPDVTFIDVWALFIRAWRSWPLYPLLLVFDLYLIVTAIKWRYFPQHNIAMNSALSILQAKKILPTPLSWIALKICPPKIYTDFIGEHFRDFPDDMIFFQEMFEDAFK
jgi:hypothetical protein